MDLMRGERVSGTRVNNAHKNLGIDMSHFQFKRATSPRKLKRKNCHIFQTCYTDLCEKHHIPMIFPIKAHIHKRILDFNGDRVKLEEWRPILKALSLDRSLHLVAIRSKTSCSRVLEHIDSEMKAKAISKVPVMITNFIFKRLMASLSCCLIYNSHLKCLELDGLLLSGPYLQSLLSGLGKSSSLQHLSLHRCPLGDEGCKWVCSTLRNLPNILTVDMSGCNISAKGAYFLAETLQYQNLNRYGENWKQSLRYRTPDTDIMPGLRRVTLNHNPLIGDTGLGHFITVLRDDLWLRALDLQNVGLTCVGGMEILNLLQDNKSLSILDVHNNPALDINIFESIMNVLATNNVGKKPEYHWIQEDTLCLPHKPSYHSKDPLSSQKMKTYDTGLSKLHLQSNKKISAVRQTQSNVVSSTKQSELPPKRTQSTSAISTPRSNFFARKAHLKSLIVEQMRVRQRYQKISKWEKVHAGGDVDDNCQTIAKIQDLTKQLEEEKQKRIEAEQQKAILEFKLSELDKARVGRVLVDESVFQEIIDGFAVFNGFVAGLSKSGILPISTDDSERLMEIAVPKLKLVDSVNQNSILTSTETSEESSLTALLSPLSGKDASERDESESSSSSTIDTAHIVHAVERKSESSSSSTIDTAHIVHAVERKSESSSSSTSDSARIAHAVERKSYLSANEEFMNEVTQTKKVEDENQDSELREAEIRGAPKPCRVQRVLHETIQPESTNFQLRNILKSKPLSYVLNRQSNLPTRFLSKFASERAQENIDENSSSKDVNTSIHDACEESSFTDKEALDADDQGWSTVSEDK